MSDKAPVFGAGSLLPNTCERRDRATRFDLEQGGRYKAGINKDGSGNNHALQIGSSAGCYDLPGICRGACAPIAESGWRAMIAAPIDIRGWQGAEATSCPLLSRREDMHMATEVDA